MLRQGISAILVLLMVTACSRQEPETQEQVFKDQVQALDKAKQAGAVIQQQAEDLQEQVEAQTGHD